MARREGRRRRGGREGGQMTSEDPCPPGLNRGEAKKGPGGGAREGRGATPAGAGLTLPPIEWNPPFLPFPSSRTTPSFTLVLSARTFDSFAPNLRPLRPTTKAQRPCSRPRRVVREQSPLPLRHSHPNKWTGHWQDPARCLMLAAARKTLTEHRLSSAHSQPWTNRRCPDQDRLRCRGASGKVSEPLTPNRATLHALSLGH